MDKNNSDNENKNMSLAINLAIMLSATVVAVLLRIQPMNETGIDFVMGSALMVLLLSFPAWLTSFAIGKVYPKYQISVFSILLYMYCLLAIMKEQQVSIAGDYPRNFKECVMIKASNAPERIVPTIVAICEKGFDRDID